MGALSGKIRGAKRGKGKGIKSGGNEAIKHPNLGKGRKKHKVPLGPKGQEDISVRDVSHGFAGGDSPPKVSSL